VRRMRKGSRSTSCAWGGKIKAVCANGGRGEGNGIEEDQASMKETNLTFRMERARHTVYHPSEL